ncbi:MAG: DNA gyrase inhibitor YacG [Zoogloeaceae bacterium]|jgi:endogenous inhibitor of DNA gyrase (YacG/DUF329 family)|nr:DNA gyrase inhibitor YacG [Zoogloeaceae bacterium]
MKSAGSPQQVLCPQCGKPSRWNSGNPWRPFCSERCKLVDLGAWANETYRVPDEGGAVSDGLAPDDFTPA